jgi:SAM-dependent methyltransferase
LKAVLDDKREIGAQIRLDIDRSADLRFRALARSLGLDADNRWVGGYVDYEWNHGRHVYQTVDASIDGKLYLEFGCNYGATSIVLAALGAKVVAIDVDERALDLACANALRYRVRDRVAFVLGSKRAPLPFTAASFDRVVCNSVLEYLPSRSLSFFQCELNRVLKPGGLLFVSGTSNRLALREIHSRRWFANYVPIWIDAFLRPGGSALQRGVSPWRVRHGFGDYENLDWIDGGRAYLEARALMSPDDRQRLGRKLAHRVARLLGVSLGLLTPSLAVVLRKRSA